MFGVNPFAAACERKAYNDDGGYVPDNFIPDTVYEMLDAWELSQQEYRVEMVLIQDSDSDKSVNLRSRSASAWNDYKVYNVCRLSVAETILSHVLEIDCTTTDGEQSVNLLSYS